MEVVQLSFPWWADETLWRDDGSPEVVSTVYRPTEERTLRRLEIQSRIMARQGRQLNLSWSHKLCLRLERTCMRDYPHYADVAGWIHERTSLGYRQVSAILDEAGQIIALRELLGLPALDIADDKVAVWRAA